MSESKTFRKSEGRLELVDVDRLIESPWNPNQMTEETFNALLETMRLGGMFCVKPVDLFPVGLDDRGLVRLQISDGHNRVRAAKQLGWKRIRAEVTTMTEDEAKVLNYERNWQRGQMNPVKEGELFFTFWKKGKGGLTEEEIAERFHRSQAHVSERLGLLKMPLEAQVAVETGALPSTHAEQIYHAVIKSDNGVIGQEAETAVARVVVAEKLTPEQTREVAEKIADDLSEEPKATREYIQARADMHAKAVKKDMKPHADVGKHLGQLHSDATRAFGLVTTVFDGLTIDKKMTGVSQEEVDQLYSYLVDLLNGAIARLPAKYKVKVRAK